MTEQGPLTKAGREWERLCAQQVVFWMHDATRSAEIAKEWVKVEPGDRLPELFKNSPKSGAEEIRPHLT